MIVDSHSIEICPLIERDLPDVVQIHLSAFPDSAITRLGRGAVVRYYRWLLLGPHQALCIGAFLDGALAGFCFGGTFRAATSGFLAKNRWYLAGLVLLRPWLAFGPLFRQRLQEGLHGLFHVRRNTEATVSERRKKKNSFSLLAIATDPVHQRKEIGRALMEKSEVYALENGYDQMGLTVHTHNLRAIGFYQSLGWQSVKIDGENTLMIKWFSQPLQKNTSGEHA